MEDTVLRSLQLENLRNAMEKLDQEDLTMEEIGKVYGVSKMAVSLDGS